MNRAMTPTQSRYLALGLLLLALLVLVAALGWPTWRMHEQYDHDIEERADHLARYRRVASMQADVEAAIREVEARDSRKHYLKANTPTLAAAELQGLVTRIVEARQAQVISSQVLSGTDEGKAGGPAKVALMVQMNAAMVPLQMILHTIESNEPMLFIDQLSVRAHQGRAFKPMPGVQPEFFVQMTVGAYMQAQAPEQAAGAKP